MYILNVHILRPKHHLYQSESYPINSASCFISTSTNPVTHCHPHGTTLQVRSMSTCPANFFVEPIQLPRHDFRTEPPTSRSKKNVYRVEIHFWNSDSSNGHFEFGVYKLMVNWFHVWDEFLLRIPIQKFQVLFCYPSPTEHSDSSGKIHVFSDDIPMILFRTPPGWARFDGTMVALHKRSRSPGQWWPAGLVNTKNTQLQPSSHFSCRHVFSLANLGRVLQGRSDFFLKKWFRNSIWGIRLRLDKNHVWSWMVILRMVKWPFKGCWWPMNHLALDFQMTTSNVQLISFLAL